MVMPMGILTNLDVKDKVEENLLQKVVNIRLQKMPPTREVFRKDVPDIQNQKQEAEWQAKIDARMAKLKPLPLLDPTADDFNPSKVEVASEEKEKTVITVPSKSALQKRIEDAERIVEGKPIVLGGGVAPQLVKRGPGRTPKA